jgi:hypothetical protein
LALHIQAAREFYRGRTNSAEDRILNVIQFTCLLQSDLATLIEAAGGIQDEVGTRAMGRFFGAQCYEAFEDFAALLGGRFESDMRAVGVSEDLMRDLDVAKRALRALTARYLPMVKQVRMTTVAHRDHDAELQLSEINAFDHPTYAGLSAAIMSWEAEMLVALTPVTAFVLGELTNRCGRMDGKVSGA